MKKKIVSALLTATMVCGMSVVPAVGVHGAADRDGVCGNDRQSV